MPDGLDALNPKASIEVAAVGGSCQVSSEDDNVRYYFRQIVPEDGGLRLQQRRRNFRLNIAVGDAGHRPRRYRYKRLLKNLRLQSPDQQPNGALDSEVEAADIGSWEPWHRRRRNVAGLDSRNLN